MHLTRRPSKAASSTAPTATTCCPPIPTYDSQPRPPSVTWVHPSGEPVHDARPNFTHGRGQALAYPSIGFRHRRRRVGSSRHFQPAALARLGGVSLSVCRILSGIGLPRRGRLRHQRHPDAGHDGPAIAAAPARDSDMRCRSSSSRRSRPKPRAGMRWMPAPSAFSASRWTAPRWPNAWTRCRKGFARIKDQGNQVPVPGGSRIASGSKANGRRVARIPLAPGFITTQASGIRQRTPLSNAYVHPAPSACARSRSRLG